MYADRIIGNCLRLCHDAFHATRRPCLSFRTGIVGSFAASHKETASGLFWVSYLICYLTLLAVFSAIKNLIVLRASGLKATSAEA